jgi:hypothetical protein
MTRADVTFRQGAELEENPTTWRFSIVFHPDASDPFSQTYNLFCLPQKASLCDCY